MICSFPVMSFLLHWLIMASYGSIFVIIRWLQETYFLWFYCRSYQRILSFSPFENAGKLFEQQYCILSTQRKEILALLSTDGRSALIG